MHETMYYACNLTEKINGLAGRANVQLDLFDNSVREHTEVARPLCTRHAPKARCMMEPVKKPTYPQKWPEYNLAQANEKAHFQTFLYELCQNIVEPPQAMGRPRIPYADVIFAACLKVYEGMSGRRTQTDMREAVQRGYLSRPVHYNTLSKYLEKPELTPLLKQLIIEASLPLKTIETDFAVDSSGFSTGVYVRWNDAKWGKVKAAQGVTPTERLKRQDWVKAHVMCGVKSNVVTSIEITHAHANDCPQFAPLVEATTQNFNVQSVAADKAYSSAKNLQLCLVKGAQPFIAFRQNASLSNPQGTSLWKRLCREYLYNQEWFMSHYHRRSNVETTFSMIKRKFGERLRSKTETAQVNEVLCKVLCHNLCVVIQSMYELGVEPDFRSEPQ